MILIGPSCITLLTGMLDKSRMTGALVPITGTDARLVGLHVLAPVREGAAYGRRFHAPAVVEVLLRP